MVFFHSPYALLLDAVVVVHSCPAGQFSGACYQLSPEPKLTNTEEVSSCFHSTCQNVVDPVAPLKSRKLRAKPEPGLNETAVVRCCRVERKWKKQDNGEGCWETIFLFFLFIYFIIRSNCLAPCVLFQILDLVFVVFDSFEPLTLSTVRDPVCSSDVLLSTGSADCEVLLPLDVATPFEGLDQRCSGWVMGCSSDFLSLPQWPWVLFHFSLRWSSTGLSCRTSLIFALSSSPALHT